MAEGWEAAVASSSARVDANWTGVSSGSVLASGHEPSDFFDGVSTGGQLPPPRVKASVQEGKAIREQPYRVASALASITADFQAAAS